MKYIKLDGATAKIAQTKGLAISKALMSLAKPNDNSDDVTEFMFQIVEGKDGSFALEVDDEFEIPVRTDAMLRAAVRLMKTGATTAELNAIIAKKREGGKITFRDLLPNTVTLDDVFEKPDPVNPF